MARQERAEPEFVDINDTSLMEGAESEIDVKEDWQSKSAPPPGRTEWNKPKLYRVRAFIEDENFELNRKIGFKLDDPNGVYYKKSVNLKIQDASGPWQDYNLFLNLSTGMPRGAKISPMAGFLAMMRVKIKPRMTDLETARLLLKAMQKLDGPMLIADCDWQAWDSTVKGRRGADGFGAIATIAENGKTAAGMFNFPRREDGTFNHIIHTKTGLELVAKAKVLKVYRPVEKSEEGAKAPVAAKVANGAAPPKPAPAPKPKEKESEVEFGDLTIGEDGEVVLEA